MTRHGHVHNHGQFAGHLVENDDGSTQFTYDADYVAAGGTAVSLSLPVQVDPHHCPVLFLFFHGLLSEGSARELQARVLRIDEDDAFGLLLATAGDTVGSVTVHEVDP